jgi:hypothetical protein
MHRENRSRGLAERAGFGMDGDRAHPAVLQPEFYGDDRAADAADLGGGAMGGVEAAHMGNIRSQFEHPAMVEIIHRPNVALTPGDATAIREQAMQRRVFLATALAAALPSAALAQTAVRPPRTPPPPITPENELERVFLEALRDESVRPIFRRTLLASQVSLAMANAEADSAPLEITFGQLRTGAIFTSSSRQSAVLGPASARRVMTGRQALTRLRGKNVVLNMMLTPMLTLEPEDVTALLALS